MKTIIIAATALTLGLGSYALPAFAQAEDYGQFRYTQNDPTRFAPAGLAIDGNSLRGNNEQGARDTPRNNKRSSGSIFDFRNR